ncbi:YncE family protein [Rhodococcus qingshengii]|uniref:YncE family protein n=1 Tax=Rhodococcus qingshengii TaxID=334542 RepID=UPI0035DB7739
MFTTSAFRSNTARLVTAVIALAAILAFPAAAQANPSIPGSTTADGLIWMPNYGNGDVMAFDPETLDVAATIPSVGDHPLVIKMLPDQSRMFVGNFGPATWQVSVIDTATQSVIKQIPTLGPAYAVSVLSKDGRYLYVPTGLSVVQVIDTQSLDIVRTLPIALPPAPAHIELSPDGKVIYVLSAIGTATQYDAVTGAVLSPPIFLDGFVPGWGALSEDGNTLYAVNFFSGLTTIDVPSWRVTKTVQMPINAGPLSATLSPDGTRIWVCNYFDNEIVVIDTATGGVVRNIKTEQAPVYVGFTPDSDTAYVSLVDGASGLPVQLYLPVLPGLAEQANLSNAYLAELTGLDTTMAAYDTATGTVLRSNTVKGALVAGVYPG